MRKVRKKAESKRLKKGKLDHVPIAKRIHQKDFQERSRRDRESITGQNPELFQDGIRCATKWRECQSCLTVYQAPDDCPVCGPGVAWVWCPMPPEKIRRYKTIQLRVSKDDWNIIRATMRVGGFVSLSDLLRDRLGLPWRPDTFVEHEENKRRRELIERKKAEAARKEAKDAEPERWPWEE